MVTKPCEECLYDDKNDVFSAKVRFVFQTKGNSNSRKYKSR